MNDKLVQRTIWNSVQYSHTNPILTAILFSSYRKIDFDSLQKRTDNDELLFTNANHYSQPKNQPTALKSQMRLCFALCHLQES